MTSYTKITDSDLASGALYDKVNDMADALNAGKLEKTALGSRKASTAYASGALVICEYHGDLLLKCTTAGTTGSGALDTSGTLSAGTTISDGTVVWTAVQKGTVKSVNNVLPDNTGNVQINTTSAWTLFDHKFSDHIINDIRWLRADTFSWQSGSVYVLAYNHLVEDIDGITATTETIGSYTITYYPAADGHKIVLPSQETIVDNIFNESGIAWYYILDTTNTRFKLPRNKFGFVGFRDTVGKYVPESLPNITSGTDWMNTTGGTTTAATNSIPTNNGCLVGNSTGGHGINGNSFEIYWSRLDASNSSSTYQDDAPVQQRGVQMYLYFYIGAYTQTAIEQTAGINAELFNGKQDVSDLVTSVSSSSTHKQYPSAKCLYDLLGDVETLINAL